MKYPQIHQALQEGTRLLAGQGIASPAYEALLLLAHAMGNDRAHLVGHEGDRLAPQVLRRYHSLLRRRTSGTPFAYLLGEWEFWGLPFMVNRHVLIPRPESELLVELAASEHQRLRTLRGRVAFVDVGTGSGCIIISLACELPASPAGGRATSHTPHAAFFACDSSAQALARARANARRHGVGRLVSFHRGDLLLPLKIRIERSRNVRWVFLANLPYLSNQQYKRTAPEVKREPKRALLGGRDGLKHYRTLLEQLAECAPRACTVFLEIDPLQKTKIAGLVRRSFPQSTVSFHRDLAGRIRVAQFTAT